MGWGGQRGLRAHRGAPRAPRTHSPSPARASLGEHSAPQTHLGVLSHAIGVLGPTLQLHQLPRWWLCRCHGSLRRAGASSEHSPVPLSRQPASPHIPATGHSHSGHRHGVQLSPAAPHLGMQPAQLHQGDHGVVEQEQDAGVGVDSPGVVGVELQSIGLGAVVVQDDVLEAEYPAGTEQVALPTRPGHSPQARIPSWCWHSTWGSAAGGSGTRAQQGTGDSPCPDGGGREDPLDEGCLVGIEGEEVASGIDTNEDAEGVEGQAAGGEVAGPPRAQPHEEQVVDTGGGGGQDDPWGAAPRGWSVRGRVSSGQADPG